jgi:dihydropteroate synthase
VTGPAQPAAVRTALMAIADTAAAAARSVADGADLVDLTGADPAEVAAFRAGYPGVPVCAADQAADLTRDVDLTRDQAVAGRTGVRLLCATPDEAARSGLPAGQVLVAAAPPGLLAALAAGYPVLADLPDPPAGLAPPADVAPGDVPPGAAALAVAALSAWLGAAVVRTRYPLPVRRALDLTDSVRGVRPPARTVRGLA